MYCIPLNTLLAVSGSFILRRTRVGEHAIRRLKCPCNACCFAGSSSSKQRYSTGDCCDATHPPSTPKSEILIFHQDYHHLSGSFAFAVRLFISGLCLGFLLDKPNPSFINESRCVKWMFSKDIWTMLSTRA